MWSLEKWNPVLGGDLPVHSGTQVLEDNFSTGKKQQQSTLMTCGNKQCHTDLLDTAVELLNKMAEQLINLIAKKELLSNVCLALYSRSEQKRACTMGLGKHEWNFYLRGNQPFRDSKQQCFMWKSLGISITLVIRHCLFCTVHCSFGPSIYYIHILLPM